MQQRGLIFFFVATCACAVYATKCASDACDRIICDTTITEEACDQTGGQFREKGSLCHCCNVCIPQTEPLKVVFTMPPRLSVHLSVSLYLELEPKLFYRLG
ncbi:unnamed protein product [Timema podura]|uniref:Secreted protein n=1 Tax=Timema podura TaxID=61482 RepID=A0ABN7NYW2_TIMPD|nr:unnamed protein product [Timema podura]